VGTMETRGGSRTEDNRVQVVGGELGLSSEKKGGPKVDRKISQKSTKIEKNATCWKERTLTEWFCSGGKKFWENWGGKRAPSGN